MGTRADFYVGRGESAEWLGSTARDGYPSGFDKALLKAKTEADYRAAVSAMLASREDGTTPAMGWPWPWETSGTTDYAYAFDGGKVWGSCFGNNWFNAARKEPEDHKDTKPATFPTMKKERHAPAGSARSGIFMVGFNV